MGLLINQDLLTEININKQKRFYYVSFCYNANHIY